MIVAAALRVGHLVCSMPPPARHHDVIHQMSGSGICDEDMEHAIQGFLTDGGEFLGRRDALSHARECGQGTPRRDALMKARPNTYYDGPELFSEDMW